MTMFKSAMVACGAAAMILVGTASSRALGTARGTTYLHFSGPVALPGVELAAGTYIFERVDLLGSTDVVRVMTRDRRKNLLLAITIPVSRPRSLKNGSATVSLGEARRGEAPPVTAWFPADESNGHAFIYAR
jgi:hypothetical protein